MLYDARIIFTSVCAELIERDGERVHRLVNHPPKVVITTLVNSLKNVSSYRLRQNHPTLICRYCKGVLWSPCSFASPSGSAPLGIYLGLLVVSALP